MKITYRQKGLFFHVLIILFLSLSIHTRAQLPQFYVDGCYNLDHFTNLGDFDIEAPQESWGIRFGFGFYENDLATIRINTEFGFSRRTMLRVFPQQEMRYSFNGLDWSVLSEFRWLHPLTLEGGMGISLFYLNFDNEFSEADLGSGFRNFDIFLQGGINVHVYKFLFVGTRIRYGLIPHLNYTPIMPLGGFGKDVNIINTLTNEFFLRIKFVGQ